ncbi:hypothetical protein TNCV_4986971 [Trichonephila clavipes]|nr:hypothetical protein TNCV_4986971 [Trichonephila clavipes]
MDSNSGEDLDACKLIVPLRQGQTLNNRQAASHFMRSSQVVSSQNWGVNEPNCTVICMVFKATINGRDKISPLT